MELGRVGAGSVCGRSGGRSFRKTAAVKRKDLRPHKKGLQAPWILSFSAVFSNLLLLQTTCILSIWFPLVPHLTPRRVGREPERKEKVSNLLTIF